MEAEDKESISSRIKVVPAHSVGLSPKGCTEPHEQGSSEGRTSRGTESPHL